MSEVLALIDKLSRDRSLTEEEYEIVVSGFSPAAASYAASLASSVRASYYGSAVFMRGLIEISNYCRNDCLYCGIRRSNRSCSRYRLSPSEILACAEKGYGLGFRTFVLQGGEDPYYTDAVLCSIVSSLKSSFPDCAVTLSMGERSHESYAALFAAGADRYLLRHETACPEHYARLHPSSMSFSNRMECLSSLRSIGYQVGCGFMVGSPYQDASCLARDLKFIETFRPDMCGIGPFVPHKDTPFGSFPAGSSDLTCYLLSLIRLIYPPVLLPATTALGTVDPMGREKGLKAGANVVMPNLSPVAVRSKYTLYDNKICTGEAASECVSCLGSRIKNAGYQLVVDRGDIRKEI